MVNIEAAAIAALRAAGIEAYADVPRDRPEAFATVESLGGEPMSGGFLASASVGAVAWAGTRWEASELALRCRSALMGMADSEGVWSAECGVPYPSVSADGIPRYEVDCDLVIDAK